MQNVTFQYVQTLNRQQKMHGHLFQGRFKSILVQGGCYFRQLVRYIHLNPVRARLVKDPMHYPWSSHAIYTQTKETWISRDIMLEPFGANFQERVQNYLDYIYQGIGKKPEVDFKTGCKEGTEMRADWVGSQVVYSFNLIETKLILTKLKV